MRSPSDNLTIVVEPSTGILRAAWARPLLTASLIDSYYSLLEEATARTGCRFWHLDQRTRIWPAATFMVWLSDTFAPVAVQQLGGPVYVACWVGSSHRPHVEAKLTFETQRRLAAVGFYPMFFEKEAAARAWLLRQQAHDARPRQAA